MDDVHRISFSGETMDHVRRRALPALLVLGLWAALLTVLAAPASALVDKDCGDFASQKAAQIFFLKNGGPGKDPHALDADSDGIACETLPCPCYTKKVLPDGDGSTPAPTGPTQVKQRAKVLSVTDGDTVKVRLLPRGPRRNVRLIGIDTPEVYGGVECAGPQASRSLKRMLPRGTRVRMLSDTSQDLKDRYGRLLRYVHKAANGRDMNRVQVRKGWARVYVYGGNPFHRVKAYRTSQSQARDAERGLWGKC